jgi:predicted nucleic acid-binding protein
MTSRALIDTNVPIYAAGRPHALKEPCAEILTMAASAPDRFVTDAEVFQELLHRYRAIERWESGKSVFNGFLTIMRDHVEPVTVFDVEYAAAAGDRFPRLSARDLLHLGVMARVGCTAIVTADAGFDVAPGVERLDPDTLDAWRARFTKA